MFFRNNRKVKTGPIKIHYVAISNLFSYSYDIFCLMYFSLLGSIECYTEIIERLKLVQLRYIMSQLAICFLTAMIYFALCTLACWGLLNVIQK